MIRATERDLLDPATLELRAEMNERNETVLYESKGSTSAQKERLIETLLRDRGGADSGVEEGLAAQEPEEDSDARLLELIKARFGGDSRAVSKLRDYLNEKGIESGFFTWP